MYVSLTEQGAALFDSLYPDHLGRIRESMGGLTDKEYEQLTLLLERISPAHVDIARAPTVPLVSAR